jgi:hypothetical protein
VASYRGDDVLGGGGVPVDDGAAPDGVRVGDGVQLLQVPHDVLHAEGLREVDFCVRRGWWYA